MRQQNLWNKSSLFGSALGSGSGGKIGKYMKFSIELRDENVRWALSQIHKSFGKCQNKLSLQFLILISIRSRMQFLCVEEILQNQQKCPKIFHFYGKFLMIYARVWICLPSHKSFLNCLHSLRTFFSCCCRQSFNAFLTRRTFSFVSTWLEFRKVKRRKF